MDLRQTDDFLTAIMKPGYAEKERASKPSSFESNGPRQLNGRPKMPRVDSFSRFSDPPAPPPQQPLPEKPDAPPRNASDSFSPLKRSDTEKTKPATSSSSPVSRDSSQILNLIEALSSAKREIDTQGARVKELETLVLQERAARESAEEKVKNLELHLKPQTNGVIKSEDDPAEQESAIQDDHDDSEEAQKPNGSILPSEASAAPDAHLPARTAVDTTQLEHRLETMMQEMEDMRKQMASFKDRAEKAEEDNVESRASLAEMIETLRRERAEKALVTTSGPKSDPQGHDQSKTTTEQVPPIENGAVDLDKKGGSSVQPLDPASADGKEMDAAPSAMATEYRRRQFLHDTSPYASMVGVVLLGVGIMAYLNGWQKLEK